MNGNSRIDRVGFLEMNGNSRIDRVGFLRALGCECGDAEAVNEAEGHVPAERRDCADQIVSEDFAGTCEKASLGMNYRSLAVAKRYDKPARQIEACWRKHTAI